MENKLIVSIEKYGTKFSTEASADIDAYDFAEIVFKLMCSTGYNKQNIIDELRNVINDNDDN